MENPILYQGVGGLMAVFFLVLIYYFTKTWRWFHILVVFCVFVSTFFLAAQTALVYRTHNAWRSLETRTSARLLELETERDLLRFGDLYGAEQAESMQSITGKLGRAIVDLGRVWRHCTPQGVQADGTVMLSTAPPGAVVAPPADPGLVAPVDPAAAAAAAPAPQGPQPNRIEPQTVLYVFIEDLAPPEAGLPQGAKIPRYYLGEFLAASATDTTVALAPVFALTDVDVTMMRQPNLTWSLYESLPVDGHELYAKDPEAGGKLNESAETSSVFGDIDPAMMQVLIPPPDRRYYERGAAGDAAFQLATQKHAEAFKNYLRDGLRSSPDDPPLNVWLKIRFKEKYSEVVDSGAKVSALQLGATDDFFDRGLAEVAMLQRGSKADFKTGDVAVFPQEDGNRLLQEKTPDGKPICELVEPVYVRTLNNYAFLFRQAMFRQNRVMSDIARISRDIAEIKKTQLHINEQQTVANTEQTQLNADIAKTTYEKTKIAEYHAVLEKSLNDLRAQLSLLFRSNAQLEAELEQANQRLTDEINRRTQSVANAE
jgi:hypothetical protein